MKIACLSVSEFAIFSNPTIRNLYGKPKTNTGKFSLLKKACRKGKLPYPHSAKEPPGGVTVRGYKGEPDEGPCGRSLVAPPWNEDSIVNRIII